MPSLLARALLLTSTQMRSVRTRPLLARPGALGAVAMVSSVIVGLGLLLQTPEPSARAWEYGVSPASLPAIRIPTAAKPWAFLRSSEAELDLSYPEIMSLLKNRMPRGTRPRTLEALASQLLRLCRDLGFQPSFILAVIEHESGFRPRARSHRDAQGLMQLRPSTASEVARSIGLRTSGSGVLNLRDPVINVTLGMHYLAQLRTRFGSLKGTLAAYNLGPARWAELLSRSQKLAPGGDTARYVALIERTSTQLKIEGRSAWKPRLAGRSHLRRRADPVRLLNLF